MSSIVPRVEFQARRLRLRCRAVLAFRCPLRNGSARRRISPRWPSASSLRRNRRRRFLREVRPILSRSAASHNTIPTSHTIGRTISVSTVVSRIGHRSMVGGLRSGSKRWKALLRQLALSYVFYERSSTGVALFGFGDGVDAGALGAVAPGDL